MKILEINSVNYGSTGNIMFSIANLAEKHGHIVYTASGFTKRKLSRHRSSIVSHIPAKLLHTYMARFTGYNGCFSLLPTLALIVRMNRIKPDLIHLHNLHGWYVNIPLLFRYIKKHRIPVVWTLHDCWALTGQCPHFTILKCDKWKTGCHDCSYPHNEYPQTRVDRSAHMWKLKKRWFTGVDNMIIVTPSQWLSNLVKQSFLREYDVKIINNGIDLSVFHPTLSDFRKKYHLGNKYMILGVSLGWNYKKGLDVFVKLANVLGEKYQIVLVGTDLEAEKQLPQNVITVRSTDNQKELAEIYTAADVFVNPSREENYPTVDMEALACGTPVITFNVGGGPEIVTQECGIVLECDDLSEMESAIEKVCTQLHITEDVCVNRATEFNMHTKFQEYVELYENTIRN